MDAKTRLENDHDNDLWSAEGTEKRIQIFLPSERDVAAANLWHEFFFWKPIDGEIYQRHFPDRTMSWDFFKYERIFFKPFSTIYSDWGKNIDRYSNASTDAYAYKITYVRAIRSPYLKELGKVQDECEDLVAKIGSQYIDLDKAEEKLRSLLPFGKAKARQEKEDAERKIPILRELLERQLDRVNELRALILGQ